MENRTCPNCSPPSQFDVAECESCSRSIWIDAVLRQHEGKLLRYSEKFTGDLDRSRELVQEVFLRLCRQDKNQFDSQGDSYLTKWLFRVCRNLSIDSIRKEKKMTTATKITSDKSRQSGSSSDASFESSQSDPLVSLADHGSNPAMVAEQSETESQVAELVIDLSAKQQEVLRLKFQNGLSYKEIAEVTKTTVSNVGVILHSAIKKLRLQMKVSQE